MTDMKEMLNKLRTTQEVEESSRNGCRAAMKEAGMPYPCAADCPCAVLQFAIDMADRIERLENLLSELRDMRVERRDHATMDEAEAVMPWTLWEAVLEDIKEILGKGE